MNERIQEFNLTRGVVPVTLMFSVLFLVVTTIAGGIWWAATMSNEQASINEKLDRVLEIQETVGKNSASVKSLEADLAAEQYKNEALLQWVITTRLKLAEQGFQTSELPSGVLRR